MPNIKQLSMAVGKIKGTKSINWYPGHMFSGMKAMIGKLNTVDCVVEVHDARIPFTGRNSEMRQHLGLIKPHVLVLNKRDLADLSRWDAIRQRLHKQGDKHVILTDLSGSQFSFIDRGYNKLMEIVVRAINQSDRLNRQAADHFKMMVVGIPNVGKSTLINRLRQHHIGRKGEPAKTGPHAGVTRSTSQTIKICSRPPIYSIDTPGVLEPSSTKGQDQAMRLALCSTINDSVLNPMDLARYLLRYLNENDNFSYTSQFGLEAPASCLEELFTSARTKRDMELKEQSIEAGQTVTEEGEVSIDQICWTFIRGFRRGAYGKVMFD